MAETIERVKTEDPEALRRYVGQLERELAGARAEQPPAVVEVPVVSDTTLERIETVMRAAKEASAALGAEADGLLSALARVRAPERPQRRPERASAARVARPETPTPTPTLGAEELSRGATGLLMALARHHPMRVTRAHLATLAGRSIKSSSFGAQVVELRRTLAIADRGGLLGVTDSGLALAGVETNTPTSPGEVLDTWRRALPAGPRRMLEALRAHPEGLTREELADRAGFSPSSSSVGSHLKKLRDNGLAVVESGNVHASDLILDRPERDGGRTR